ncbi:MAG TPA: hypothetical protein VE988_26050 [Gemmataceae bacterium]|nr:hypothetical protein [Gemmataceae bacterium]
MNYRWWWVSCLLLALTLAAGCSQEPESKSTFKVDLTLRVPTKKADGNYPP